MSKGGKTNKFNTYKRVINWNVSGPRVTDGASGAFAARTGVPGAALLPEDAPQNYCCLNIK